MTAALATLPLRQLGKLVRLLGSDQDGEILAAAAAMARVLERCGRDFNDFGAFIERDFANDASRIADGPMPRAPKEMVIELLERWQNVLDDWQLAFCRSVARQRQPLTVKQRIKIAEIFERATGWSAR